MCPTQDRRCLKCFAQRIKIINRFGKERKDGARRIQALSGEGNQPSAAKAPEHAQEELPANGTFSRKEGGFGMAQLDCGQIAQHPKFQELSRRKKRFLIGWWIFSTLFYFGLPIWAGNTISQSDIGNMKIIGKIPLLYLYALAQYALCLVIAV